MQYRELHPWRVSATEARCIQQRLRRHIQVGTYVHEIRYIAGADIAVSHTTPTVYAGVVVLDYTTLAVVERKGVVTTTDFPYILSMWGLCAGRMVWVCEGRIRPL